MASILAQDHYYRDQSSQFDEDGGAVNFDHPSAIDFELLQHQLELLAQGQTVEVPRYDFATHRRLNEPENFSASPVIILDGTLLLSHEGIRDFFDLSVFLEVPESIRFDRRLQRDTRERDRCPSGVYKQFFTQVKPMHDQFVQPSKSFAEHIMNDPRDFDDLLERVTDRIRVILKSHSSIEGSMKKSI